MVLELNFRYIPDETVEILLDTGEIVSLDTFIQSQVQPPAYIIGDSVQAGAFSVRFPTPLLRQDALDFIAAVKPYCTAGKVQGHICHHDTGGPCGAVETMDSWNWTEVDG